jgi:hypothetical protein
MSGTRIILLLLLSGGTAAAATADQQGKIAPLQWCLSRIALERFFFFFFFFFLHHHACLCKEILFADMDFLSIFLPCFSPARSFGPSNECSLSSFLLDVIMHWNRLAAAAAAPTAVSHVFGCETVSKPLVDNNFRF